MSLMYCPECGKEISSTFVACPYCGHKLEIEQENPIATAEFEWTYELNKKFQAVHWAASGEKKKYWIFQIIFLLLLVLPGIYYAIVYWIVRPMSVKKVFKNDLKNNNGVNAIHKYEFYKECFVFSSNKTKADLRYDSFGKVILNDESITFIVKALNAGFYIPLNSIDNKYEFLETIKQLNIINNEYK